MELTKPSPDLYAAYVDRMRKIADIKYSAAVLEWDQETYLPPKGAAARSRQLASLSEVAHEGPDRSGPRRSPSGTESTRRSRGRSAPKYRAQSGRTITNKSSSLPPLSAASPKPVPAVFIPGFAPAAPIPSPCSKPISRNLLHSNGKRQNSPATGIIPMMHCSTITKRDAQLPCSTRCSAPCVRR